MHRLVWALGIAGCAHASDPDASAAWARLVRTLPGAWHATTDAGGAGVDVSFRMISRDSAVAETFGPPGHDTMTLYHRDGLGLVATHYCAQGNQPRLRAIAGDARHVVLELADATDVDRGEAELVELDYDFADGADRFDRVEIYEQPDGSLERTAWHYARVAPAR